MNEAKRRVALVTGAGRGIGRATALALAAAGTPVVLTARTVGELDGVVAEITAAGGEGAALTCDLGDRAQTVTLIERAAAAFGPDRHPRQQRRESAAAPIRARWPSSGTRSGTRRSS